MVLDVDRARSVGKGLARQSGLTIDALAEGIVRIANVSMERAIRRVSLERGHDPRRFTLVAFGGAGGMHACEIAAELDIGTVLVPRHAGVLSAMGMLAADVTRDYSVAVLERTERMPVGRLNRQYKPLVARARDALRAEGFSGARQVIRQQIDVRYAGQSYELTVPWSPDFEREFHRRHRHVYGHANAARPTEIVALRVRAIGLTEKPVFPRARVRPHAAGAPHAVRPARFGGRSLGTSFYRWDSLKAGARGRGPAVITGGEATIVAPPGFGFDLDGFSNVVLRRRS